MYPRYRYSYVHTVYTVTEIMQIVTFLANDRNYFFCHNKKMYVVRTEMCVFLQDSVKYGITVHI